MLLTARNREEKTTEYQESTEDMPEVVKSIKEKVISTKQRQKIRKLFETSREVFNAVKQKREIEAKKALDEFSYFVPIIQGDPVNLIETLSQINIHSSYTG